MKFCKNGKQGISGIVDFSHCMVIFIVLIVLIAGVDSSAYTISNGDVSVDISNTTGAITGIWKNGTKVISGTVDSYSIETLTHAVTTGVESADSVTQSQVGSNQVTLTCTNAALTGLTIVKYYGFDYNVGTLVKKVTFTNTAGSGRFVKYYAKSTLDSTYRASGRYVRFDSHYQPFDTASSITNDTSLTNAPTGIHWMYFDNATVNVAVAQYRYLVNDSYCVPIISYDWDSSSAYTSSGWKFPVHADFLAPSASSSGQTNFYFGTASPLKYLLSYRALPAVAALNAEFVTPGWIANLKLDDMYGPSVTSLVPGKEVTATNWMIPCYWSDWFAEASGTHNPWNLFSGGPWYDSDVQAIADMMANWATVCRPSVYSNQYYVDIDSHTFADFPNYVVVNASNAYDDFGIPDNTEHAGAYLKQIREPGCVDYFVDQYVRRINNFHMKFAYIDGSLDGVSRLDWRINTVQQNYDWIDFYRHVRTAMAGIDPNITIFSNSGTLGNPFADITYTEILSGDISGITGSNWRVLSNTLFVVKAMQLPGHPVAMLYVNDDHEPEYENYALGMGFLWSTGGLPAVQTDAPKKLVYIDAAYELRQSGIVDAVRNPWWSSNSITVESYALQRGAQIFVPVINHGASGNKTITLDSTSLGLTPQRKVWVLDQQLVEPAMLSAPAVTSAMQNQTLYASSWTSGDISITTNARENLLTHLTLTQLPVFVKSVNGKQTQTGLANPADVDIVEISWNSLQPNKYNFQANVGASIVELFIPLALGQTLPDFIRVDGKAYIVTAETRMGVDGYSLLLKSGKHRIITSSFTLAADLDGSGKVDFKDFSILAQEWLNN